ncbi:MAG: hypothetical protein P4M09_14640 [Devosia sp.]|nr:hypothetical protein [Devosia sp.]
MKRNESKNASTRIAIVEVGSNSIRFLVGDFDQSGAFDAVSTKSIRLHIGTAKPQAADVENINEEVDRLIETAGAVGYDELLAYGTALCRRIAAEMPEKLDRRIRVLNAREEATAAWAAAFMCERDRSVPTALTVIDLGTGSTEIAVGSWDGSMLDGLQFTSLDLGTASLVDLLRSSGKLFPHRVVELLSSLELAELGAVGKFYLVGGVATKIGWMKVRRNGDQEYKPYLVNGVSTSPTELIELYQKLAKLRITDSTIGRKLVDARPGSEDEFERVLTGSVFLAGLTTKLGAGEALYISGYGLRHGAAFLLQQGLWS